MSGDEQTVLVVEDDRRLRQLVVQLLENSHRRVTTAGTAREALAACGAEPPDVALVDLGLPDLDGVELIAQLAGRHATLPILVLTVADTEARILAALRAGARGYLFKEDIAGRLSSAIDEVLVGGVPVSPAVGDLLLARLRDPRDPAPPPSGSDGVFSPRESDVMRLLGKGLRYDEIASALGISTNTVRTHVRAIYEKLDVNSKTEAVMEAIRRGLLPQGGG